MNIIFAGIIAGLGMAAVMGSGERLGLLIHLVTSISFAIGYVLFRMYLVPDWRWTMAGVVWTVILWFLFGLTVSPVTGFGLFGSKAGKWAWFELLITHCVYGIILTLLLR